MNRFRRIKTQQKFCSVHASVHNLFNQERHLISRQDYRERRSAALEAWRSVMGQEPVGSGRPASHRRRVAASLTAPRAVREVSGRRFGARERQVVV
jgi:hypothetical protein